MRTNDVDLVSQSRLGIDGEISYLSSPIASVLS
jgi:hypothetical protein